MKVIVTGKPKTLAKGQWECVLSKEGISLTQRKRDTIRIPIGTEASFGGKNSFAVDYEAGQIEVFVIKFGSYQNRLARDISEWLSGRGEMPEESGYGMEWYYYCLCALPLGIPIITVGGALPAAVGFGLAGGNLAIAQKEEWSTPRRVLTCLALVGIAYGLLISLLMAANQE